MGETKAMTELAEMFSRVSGHEQEQAARFLLNALNTPVRRFIIPLPDGRTPYLERFILNEGLQELPPDKRHKVYLHVIYESDSDRDPHDHPFDFESHIIWGTYREQRYYRLCVACDISHTSDVKQCSKCGSPKLKASPEYGPQTYEEGMFNLLRAHRLHRLTVVKGPVVTLVKRGPKVREWGFQTDDGWEHHSTYIQRKFPGAQPTEVD